MTREEILKILNGYQGGKVAPESHELYNAITAAIEILEQPSLPSNLDEAANAYVGHEEEIDEGLTTYIQRKSFKAGYALRDSQIPKLPENLDEAAKSMDLKNIEGGARMENMGQAKMLSKLVQSGWLGRESRLAKPKSILKMMVVSLLMTERHGLTLKALNTLSRQISSKMGTR